MLIDTHCHLSSKQFGGEVEMVVKEAVKAGVEKIVMPAVNIKDAKKVIEICGSNKMVFGLVGIYPGEAQKKGGLTRELEEIERMIREEEKVVGIGEIGLDCYWDRRNLEEEKKVFAAQLKLAVSLNVPVAIHSRASEKEIKEVFENIEPLPRGQFHCFGESGEFLKYVLEKGFYVSFCGNVTYPSASHLRNLAVKVPLSRLLLETDSPYLPPQGHRGERNSPASVKITAEFLAKLRGESFEELADATTKNAEELFGI